MNNVIQANFGSDNNSGYITEDIKGSDKKDIKGVYNGGLIAVIDGGELYVGGDSDRVVSSPVKMSIKDMNQFCLMWLLIFDQSVIKEDL